MVKKLFPILFVIVALVLAMVVPVSAADSNGITVYDSSVAWNTAKVTFFPTGAISSYSWQPFYSDRFPFYLFSELIPPAFADTYVNNYYYDYPGRMLVGNDYVGDSVGILGDFYFHLEREWVLGPGESIQFYICPIEVSFVRASDNVQVSFNNMSSIGAGTIASNGMFNSVSGITGTLESNVSTYGTPIYRYTVANTSEDVKSVDAFMLRFPTNTVDNYEGVRRVNIAFSNVLYIGSGSTVLPDPDLGNINDSLDDIYDVIIGPSVGTVPDLDSVTGDPSYNVGDLVGEDDAVDDFGRLNDNVDSLLSSPNFFQGASFWQATFSLIFEVPAIMVMVTLVSCLIVIRTLFGR